MDFFMWTEYNTQMGGFVFSSADSSEISSSWCLMAYLLWIICWQFKCTHIWPQWLSLNGWNVIKIYQNSTWSCCLSISAIYRVTLWQVSPLLVMCPCGLCTDHLPSLWGQSHALDLICSFTSCPQLNLNSQ